MADWLFETLVLNLSELYQLTQIDNLSLLPNYRVCTFALFSLKILTCHARYILVKCHLSSKFLGVDIYLHVKRLWPMPDWCISSFFFEKIDWCISGTAWPMHLQRLLRDSNDQHIFRFGPFCFQPCMTF